MSDDGLTRREILQYTAATMAVAGVGDQAFALAGDMEGLPWATHAMSEEAYAAHPEWAACTADGKPRRHWAAADMWVTCQNGGFYFDFMPQVLKEMTDLYQPEGFFGNRWAGSGMCYCQTCKDKFRAATGLELPTSDDPQEPRRKAYIQWNLEMRARQFQLWDGTVKASKKDSFFSPNGGMNDPNVMIP